MWTDPVVIRLDYAFERDYICLESGGGVSDRGIEMALVQPADEYGTAVASAEPRSTSLLARLLAPWAVPAVLVGHDAKVLAWNRGAVVLYGIEEADAVGGVWPALVHEEPGADPAQPLGPETLRYEVRHRTRDGNWLEVVVTRTALVEDLGEPARALFVVTDLTASKSIEARLKRRIAELSIIREIDEVLQSAMGLTEILRTILIGATASQGLRFNRAFLLLVDEKRPELRGRLAIGPSDREEANRIWSELSRSHTPLKDLLRQYEPYVERDNSQVNEIVRGIRIMIDDEGSFLVRALRAGRTSRVVTGTDSGSGTPVEDWLVRHLGVDSFVAVPLVAEGKPVGLLLADNAFTGRPVDDEDVEVLELLGIKAALAIERAHLTRDLEIQVASLESANKQIRQNQERLLRAERLSAVGEMAARVAHEIRNPLVAIGGFARLLLRDAPAEGEMRENLQIITSEVRRLEQILREVLDYSNPTPLRRTQSDLTKVSHEALELLRCEMDDGRIRGNLKTEPGMPEVSVDRNQIFQALINIMNNAIHAMPQGGDLSVHLRHRPGWAEIAISDTGTGIDADVRSKIFEPFFTTRSTGSGLGLTIARHIVQDHRGEIALESSPGVGTTFILRLPAVQEGVADVEDSGG